MDMFTQTHNVVSFVRSVGGTSIDIVRSPKTGLRFFAIPGTNVTGRISKKVKKLSKDLSISWFVPEDAVSEEEHSWILHPTAVSANIEDSMPI